MKNTQIEYEFIEICNMQLLSWHNNDPSPINKKKFPPKVYRVYCTNLNIHGSGHPHRFPRQCQCSTLKIAGKFN